MILTSSKSAGRAPWLEWLSNLSKIHSDGDYIVQERFLESSRSLQFDYRKRDFLYRKGKWRGVNQTAVVRDKTESRVLALGHSDYSFSGTDVFQTLTRTGFKRVFATNLTIPFRTWLNVQPLPLGLSNPTAESQLHRIFGDIKPLSSAWSKSHGQIASYQIYINFDPTTSRERREKIFALAKSARDVFHVGTYSPTTEGRSQYLDEIASHGLVVCPEGNGRDTHRYWETLYLGGIPVVERNSYGARLSHYLRLPAIVVGSWKSLLDLNKVQIELEHVLSSTWNSKALQLSQWLSALASGSIGEVVPIRSSGFRKRQFASASIIGRAT